MSRDNSRRSSLHVYERSYLRPSVSAAPPDRQRQSSQTAASGVVRNQINTIYEQEADKQATQAASFAATSHTSEGSPYDRTHEQGRTHVPAEQWKRYHSAWQDYYRQYYERYYIGEVYRMRETLEAQAKSAPTVAAPPDKQPQEEPVDNEEAFRDLRIGLLSNVRDSATKVRRSQHFMPLAAASLTVVLFLFLNYNRVLFANVEAYVSPSTRNPVNIIVDPNIDVPISHEPRLIIPKINVDVPVVYDAKPDEASQMKAMEGGVAWFGIPGANSRPGQVGNTVLSGHSSNDLFDPGDYKFIFARLDQLVHGDTFYVNYQGVRYIYSITKKEVVLPTDVHKLIYDTDGKPVMTLITCVPLGTAQKRLLVTAEQISPSPSQATEAPSTPAAGAANEPAMPGNSPTLLGRLFGS